MSSWFAEGTVTITNGSTVVAGLGTKFSNCRSGDMFVGPDNGIYQVINPSSDTSVSISPAYRGTTVAGAAYGIVPVNGYPKALADAVNLMVQQWGATLAGLGSVSTENIVPVTKGGTGGTTQATARAGLGLGSAAVAAIVGTVLQAGGVPTGAIIERGSSSNGAYTKFADGTMICNRTAISMAATANTTIAGSYTFPAAFSEKPMVLPGLEYPTANDSINVSRVSAFASNGAGCTIQFKADITQTYMVAYVAIGRWY